MSIWTNWDPLEEVIVGDCYSPGEFDWAVDSEITESFNQILQETKEDLDNLARLLESFGVVVHRPQVKNFNHPIECSKSSQPNGS